MVKIVTAAQRRMSFRVRKIFKKLHTWQAVAALLLICFCAAPSLLCAENTEFYTIQTGSFVELSSAEKVFDQAVLGLIGLDEFASGCLRIEKIGKFYTVRVGRFATYYAAEEFLQGSRSQLPGAIILRATIKEERILRQYDHGTVDEIDKVSEVSMPPDKPESAAEINEMQVQKKPATEEKVTFVSKIKGRVTASDFYLRDSGGFDLHVATARLNLYKREESAPGFFFEVDGRVRKKIVRGDFDGFVPQYRVDEAWLGYLFPGESLTIIGGRQYIQELYNTDVDGLNVKYSFQNGLGMGIFGGYAPDKFDDSFNADYETIGGYGFLNLDDHKVSLGYEYLTYNDEPDREYFSLRAYSKLSNALRFNGLMSVNKNQLTDNFEVETANANITYSYNRDLRFNLFMNYYRTIKYYASSKIFLEFSDSNDNFTLDTNSRTRGGLRVDYTIARGLKVYGSVVYQHRNEDDEDSTRFTGGIRMYDLYGFDLSGRYTYIHNFTTRDHEYKVEVNRKILNLFDMSVYCSFEESKLDVENAYTLGTRSYGASLYWPLTKHFYLTMFGEYLDGEDYHSTSVFGQLGFKL